MRPWPLLVSLLLSDLCPLGAGVRFVKKRSGKLLINGRMAPGGLQILQLHHCICIQRKHKASIFPWVLPLHESTGTHRRSAQALVLPVRRVERNRVRALLVKPETLHVINEIPPTAAGGEGGRSGYMDAITDRPDSGSAKTLHHRSAAPGRGFQAFSPEKSKSWTPAAIVRLQGCRTATAEVILCRFTRAGMISAAKIKRRSLRQRAQIRLEKVTRKAMRIELFSAQDRERDVSQTAGSSATKTSEIAQSVIQRTAVRVITTNKQKLPKGIQMRGSQRAASLVSASDNDDGFLVQGQPLMEPREEAESINRPGYTVRVSHSDNKEDFSGEIMTKQAGFRHPGGERETKHALIETGNQKRLAHIRRAGFTGKAEDNGVNPEVGEEVLIMLFLPDTKIEAQTWQRQVTLNIDTGWKTGKIPIKQLDDPPPMSQVLKGNFLVEADNSKCNCLRGNLLSLEVYATVRTEGKRIEAAESAAEVTTATAAPTEARVKETVAVTPRESVRRNDTERGKDVPTEQPVVPSPQTETETAKTEAITQTEAVNTGIKETTSSTEVFNPGEADRTPTTWKSPEPGPVIGLRVAGRTSDSEGQSPTGRPLSGLRMREEVPGVTEPPGGTGEEDEAPTSGNDRKEDQGDSKVTADSRPRCGGLIHRTEVGWKDCVKRNAGRGSETEDNVPTDGTERKNKDVDPEYDHFYYFDGVLRKVQSHFPQDSKRRKRHRRSMVLEERVLRYVRHPALKMKGQAKLWKPNTEPLGQKLHGL